MLSAEFDQLFTISNAQTVKYRRYTGMSTDPTYMLNDEEVPYKNWMSKLPTSTPVTSMNIPGSYNSLAVISDELYVGFDAVKLMHQTQTLTLEE